MEWPRPGAQATSIWKGITATYRAMKRRTLLALTGWKRENRREDFRDLARDTADRRFAGLKMRGRSHIVQLHNWSDAGACIDLPGSAKIGEQVRIVSGAMQRAGRVCWIVAGKAGIEFLD